MSKQSCKSIQFDGPEEEKFNFLDRRQTRLHVFDDEDIPDQEPAQILPYFSEAYKLQDLEDQNSSVGDAAGIHYGEPSATQQLVLDFTPIPGVDDDDELIDKLTSFWLFVKEQPELKKFLVLPTPEESEVETQSSIEDPIVFSQPSLQKQKMKATAAMPFLERIDMILPPMSLAKTDCLLEDFEVQPNFHGYDTYDFEKAATYWNTEQPTMKASYIEKFASGDLEQHDFCYKSEKETNRKEFKKICEDMDEFDKKNPKSYLPPTGVSLITSVMQRVPVNPQQY